MMTSQPGGQSPGGGRQPGWRQWHGWKPLGVAIGLGAILFGGIWMWNNNQNPGPTTPPDDDLRVMHPPRSLPMPSVDAKEQADLAAAAVVARDRFEGVAVLRIRAQTAGGDEVLIEAATGRLLAVRDSQGKVTRWSSRMDDVPMTMTEPMIKGS